MTFLSCDLCSPIPLITWDQYLNCLVRERTYQVIVEYSMQTELEHSAAEASEQLPTDTTTYEQRAIKVEELKNPSLDLREQFEDQTFESPIFEGFPTLEDGFREACCVALEHFVLPDQCVVIDLGNKEYVIAPHSSSDIIVKLLSPAEGCIVVFKPGAFTFFKLSETDA